MSIVSVFPQHNAFSLPCLVCGCPVSTSRHKYCSNACKQRAYRARCAGVTSAPFRVTNVTDVTPFSFPELVQRFDELMTELRALRLKVGGGVVEESTSVRVALASGLLPDDKIEIKKAVAGRGEWNGLISMALLNGCLDTLSPEVYDYAISTGRIPEKFQKKPSAAPKGDNSIKKMDVLQFETPTFDD